MPTACEDFIQYWSAARLFLSGLNPYDATALQSLQTSVCGINHSTRLPWVPPHVILASLPFALLPPGIAVLIWTLLSLAAVWPILKHDSQSTPLLIAAATGFLFLPLLVCLGLGQLGAFLGLGSWLIWRGVERNQLLAISAGLFLTSFKPHLFALLYLFLLVSLPPNQRRILCQGGASVLLLLLLCWLASPDIWINWLSALAGSRVNAATVSEWMPHTISGLLRGSFLTSSPPGLLSVGLITFGCGSVLFAFLIYRNRLSFAPGNTFSQFFLAVAWGYLISPYGWLQDQVILLPIFVRRIAAQPTHHRKIQLLLALGATSLGVGIAVLFSSAPLLRSAIMTLVFPLAAMLLILLPKPQCSN